MSRIEFKIVIPARYASVRFPGKALAELAGRPLLAHVHERACASSAGQVLIATDDKRILAAAQSLGADCVLTDTAHASGTDRIAQVARERGWSNRDIVVNVQGDVPLIQPESIDQVAELLAGHPDAGVATLCTPLLSATEYTDANVVKVVADASGRALYFSRAPVPAVAHGGNFEASLRLARRHIGLYAYRVGALLAMTDAGPCELEQCEKLEQLRAMWLGIEIRVAQTLGAAGPDVDTPEDLVAAEKFLQSQLTAMN